MLPHRANKLLEGMRDGDLADLVLPLISVDEYTSKIDEKEAVVFGFYVQDQDAASDLNRFLQKSSVPILDTEVSPAPDQHGFFMVFVELMNNDRMAQNMSDILSEMKVLVDNDQWEMRVRDHDGLLAFSERSLDRAMERAKKREETANVLEFLQPSALGNAIMEDDLLIIEGSGERYVFEVVELGCLPQLLEKLTDAPISLTMRSVARTHRLTRMLGEDWQADIMGPYTMLHCEDDPRGLLLRT